MTHRSRFRRLSQYAAAGTVSLVAACAPDSSLTAPNESGAVMSAADAIAAVQAGPPQYVPGELLVQFRNGATTAGRGRALGRVAGQVAEEILTGPMRAQGRRVGVTRVKVSGDVPRAIAALRADENVEYAEPNWIYQHQATSNDPYFTDGRLWGMSARGNQFGSGAATAWAAGKTGLSSTVYVGIIDEGYMYTHPDLADNAGKNPGEITGNAIDDDGNGLVDDVYGWDFDGNNASVFDGAGDDHGTHVAGTIGAKGGNGQGVAGVVWNVKLLSAKFLGRRGGTTANAIKAVDYFTGLKRKGLNIVATNNSWGGGGYSTALYQAIARADTAGVLFIAAAGNSGSDNDASPSYPSGYPNDNIIAVASIMSDGAISGFSQYGATSVDIGAPGSGIWSTVPVSTKGGVVPGYASYNGTSMATPHVSGAAALYKSINPGATAAEVKAAILTSATATPSLSGKVVTNGRLNVSGF